MNDEGRHIIFTAVTAILSAALISSGQKLDGVVTKAISLTSRIMDEAKSRFPVSDDPPQT